MEIFLNNETVSTNANNLAELLKELGIDAKGIAIAVGSSVVSRSEWNDKALKQSDRITIIRATRGG